MSDEVVLSNARIVLSGTVISGSLVMRDGRIAAIDTGASAVGEDVEGDYLIAGLVELHTDHLERHYRPRPSVRWPALAAVQAQDAQIAGSGITTVFDCFRIGSLDDDDFGLGETRQLAAIMEESVKGGRLRIDHRVHLRCEVSAPNMLPEFEAAVATLNVGLVSVMDHAPGQRQFKTLDQAKRYYVSGLGWSEDEYARYAARRMAQSEENAQPNRAAVARTCRALGIMLASHDDATREHVEEAIADGIRIAEFPTTREAAEACSELGLTVMMGAPNVVRGGSHSGNISARELAGAGLLDVLSSDYVPISLIHAAFLLADEEHGVALPETIAMVTDAPAKAAGLGDRGRLDFGLRGDVVRVHLADGVPVVRAVWRGGRRIA